MLAAQVAPGRASAISSTSPIDAAETVLEHALAAVLAPEPLIELGLEAFLAAVVDVGEAEQVADDLALRDSSAGIRARAHARQAERHDCSAFPGDRWRWR